ncbi:MAG: transglycosylase SLT domain-containing protein [Myxococcota bacterium]
MFPVLAKADIYKYVDNNGIVHFTNKKPPGKKGKKWKKVVRDYSKAVPGAKTKKKCKTCDVVPSRDNTKARFTRYDKWIKEASRLYKIPVPLIKAVIKAESDFDPRVVSYKGAKGLMQIMPVVQKDMGIKHVFDPRENILGGTRLLRYLANFFKGDMILTIAGYHAGPNAVKKYGGIPPYKTTRVYVPRVLKYYYYFKKKYKKGKK